jgi:oligoribonuclease (3'-5' exoribonuclease)
MIAWTDVESTGLEPKTDHLLEVAIVITDDELNEIAHASVVVQPVGVLDVEKLDLDPEVRKMHTDNHLFEEVKATPLHRYEGELVFIDAVKAAFKDVPPVAIDKCAQCRESKNKHQPHPDGLFCVAEGYYGSEFVAKLVPALSQTPLAGSTVGFDRRFLKEHMKSLEAMFSYRSIDVSSLVELAKRWAPEIYEKRPKAENGAAHRALADVRESINYLRYFREVGFIKSSLKIDPLVALPSLFGGGVVKP